MCSIEDSWFSIPSQTVIVPYCKSYFLTMICNFKIFRHKEHKKHGGKQFHEHHSLNKSCPDDKSRATAKSCIGQLFKGKKQEHGKQDREAKQKQRCDIKKQCLSKLVNVTYNEDCYILFEV